MNWSPASANATGFADQVFPRSNDWLTTTSELVFALYGSGFAGGVLLGVAWYGAGWAGVVLLRMSDHTTARCAASLGSAAILPAAQLRNTLSWYVCRPKAIG